jgi:hypothetical protein
MAIESLTTGGLWLPSRHDESMTSIGVGTTFQINASGELVAMVFRAPKTGNLSRFEAYIGAASNVPDNGLRFSFQDVDLSTGLPDAGVDQFAIIASGSVAVGWANPGDFDAPRAVTRGDLVAAVIDISSFTAGDNVVIGNWILSTSVGFPYSVSVTTTKSQTNIPVFALRYDDGTYVPFYPGSEIWAVNDIQGQAFQSDTAIDEYGLKFQVPWPCSLQAVAVSMHTTSSNNSFDIVLYDAAGSVVDTIACDGDVSSSVSAFRYRQEWFTSDITLTPNVTYRLVVKAGSSTINCEVRYGVFPSTALKGSAGVPSTWELTQRADAGAWTDTDVRVPKIHLFLNGFDDGTGGGSGGGAHIFGGTVIR